MRRPNFKIFVYDDNARFVMHISVWALNAVKAYAKAIKELQRQNKDPDKFTLCAREIVQYEY